MTTNDLVTYDLFQDGHVFATRAAEDAEAAVAAELEDYIARTSARQRASAYSADLGDTIRTTWGAREVDAPMARPVHVRVEIPTDE